MLRRKMLLALASSGIVSCAHAPPEAQGLSKPPDAPPPSHIQRLLLWLPPSGSTPKVSAGFSPISATKPLFDEKVFADTLREKLQAHGVATAVGYISRMELDRSDDQRLLMAQFHPTHRMEVDIQRVEYGNTVAAVAQLRWALYVGQDTKPVRFRQFAVKGGDDKARKEAEYAVQQLEAEGFL